MSFKDEVNSTPDAVVRRPCVTCLDLVIERRVELAEIPAPTGLQAARHERVRKWWLEDGEWIDTSQLGTGLRCAAAAITGWERGAREGGGA